MNPEAPITVKVAIDPRIDQELYADLAALSEPRKRAARLRALARQSLYRAQIDRLHGAQTAAMLDAANVVQSRVVAFSSVTERTSAPLPSVDEMLDWEEGGDE